MKKKLIISLVVGMTACRQNNDYDFFFKDPSVYCSTVHDLNTIGNWVSKAGPILHFVMLHLKPKFRDFLEGSIINIVAREVMEWVERSGILL